MKRIFGHSSLLLFELLCGICFFCIGAAVCISVFAKSHTLSQEASDLDHATKIASSTAELFQSDLDLFTQLSSGKEGCYTLDNTDAADNTNTADTLSATPNKISLYYDNNWQYCSQEDASYQMEVQLAESNLIQTAHIQISGYDKEQSQPIYTISSSKVVTSEGRAVS